MIGGRRNLLVGAAVLVTAMTTSSGVMAAPPTTPPPTLATAAGDSIDLGDDFALPDGAPAGPLAAAPGDGFTDLSGFPNGGQYTFRLVSSPGIESFRPFVQATVDELNTIGGPYFTLAAGQAPPTADPVGYEPPPFEVHIMVSGTSPCGSLGWIGCGGPRQYRQLGGVATWSAGTVWLRPSLDGYSDVVKQEVVNHEVGHTFGLGHYDEEYEGRFQVMKSVVEVDATETGYRSGDRNGLEYKAPPPPANDALTAATPISLTHPVRDANTWFATAAGGTGQPELRSVVSTASNRSVWFRFQARAQDVGRPLVVETSNDGVEDFDTVLGRVVNGSLVASNDNAVGTRASRLVFTPTDTTTVHYFAASAGSPRRGAREPSASFGWRGSPASRRRRLRSCWMSRPSRRPPTAPSPCTPTVSRDPGRASSPAAGRRRRTR